MARKTRTSLGDTSSCRNRLRGRHEAQPRRGRARVLETIPPAIYPAGFDSCAHSRLRLSDLEHEVQTKCDLAESRQNRCLAVGNASNDDCDVDSRQKNHSQASGVQQDTWRARVKCEENRGRERRMVDGAPIGRCQRRSRPRLELYRSVTGSKTDTEWIRNGYG